MKKRVEGNCKEFEGMSLSPSLTHFPTGGKAQ